MNRPEVTLYHSRDARSFRCLWALEELSIPYRLVSMPFPPRFTTPSFVEVNPMGTVPFLVCENVEMTESSAIIQYLATRFRPDMDILLF